MITRIAGRKTSVSRHNGELLRAPLNLSIPWSQGFERGSQLGLHDAARRQSLGQSDRFCVWRLHRRHEYYRQVFNTDCKDNQEMPSLNFIIVNAHVFQTDYASQTFANIFCFSSGARLHAIVLRARGSL